MGNDWVHLGDGSVTFRERGFVAADGPAMLLARHNFELRTIAGELDGIKVAHSLEVGCGFGRLSQSIAEHSDSHTAIDINRDALELARATYSGVDFAFGSADAVPVPTGSIGLLVSWTVLQHIRPERIEATCAELLRILAPSATVLLCEEIAWPEASGGHTWHRTVEDYERLLAPLKLIRHSAIIELEAVPGMETPGEVMTFRAPA
jgi:ubiquinone/menaquinone biosynthesis C-methylase UbiE